MVHAALWPDWDPVFANDIDPKKCRTYRENWGNQHLIEGDVATLDPQILKQPIDLYWASSPCQDLSLAGKRDGLSGPRSGVFLPWIKLVEAAVLSGHGPRIIAFENVSGLISSKKGADFQDVLRAFSDLGYRAGAVEIDARHFVPQSRPRIFVIALRNDAPRVNWLESADASSAFHSPRLRKFVNNLPQEMHENWVWWNINAPDAPVPLLTDCLDLSENHAWFAPAEVARLLSLMSSRNLDKVRQMRDLGTPQVATVYKRGRPDENGVVRQRVEVRFDGVAGCLRTPAGGSSRQSLLFVEGHDLKMRLLSPREAGRLMGLPDSYRLPAQVNEAYKISGDGVVVDVVKYLKDQLFTPLLGLSLKQLAA